MAAHRNHPKVLVVTPEIAALLETMGPNGAYPIAKATDLADVASAIVRQLFTCGVDTHLALPDYRDHLYFRRLPSNYEESRGENPVDFLVSGIFASSFITTTNPLLWENLGRQQSSIISPDFKREWRRKQRQGCVLDLRAMRPSALPGQDPPPTKQARKPPPRSSQKPPKGKNRNGVLAFGQTSGSFSLTGIPGIFGRSDERFQWNAS